MKNKKKNGPEPIATFIFDGGMPFHNNFDHIWAYGLAIIGTAQESFDEAAAAFEQLCALQSLSSYWTDFSEHEEEIPISWPQEFVHLQNASNWLCSVPVVSGVLWNIYDQHEEKATAKALLKQYYPALLNFQRTLYQRRDLNEDGLITNIHPWETGQGGSERWREIVEEQLKNGGYSLEAEAPGALSPSLFQAYQLLDRSYSSPVDEQIRKGAFRIQDPFFHAFLSWSNESLIKIGAALGQDVQEIIEWYELSTYSINQKLWNPERHRYCPFDENMPGHLPIDILESAVCLFSEVATQDYAELMYPSLEKRLKKDFALKIRAAEQFPLAIARQVLLLQSLQNYGFDDLSIQLMQRLGFVMQQLEKKEIHKDHFLLKGLWLFLNR